MILDRATKIADILLDIQAVKLSVEKPFQWASGLHSPIYCDNRKILSYPKQRAQIIDAFEEMYHDSDLQVNCIAGVATGGIAHGVLLAERLKKPFIYVRSKAKGHGLENQIEGAFKASDKVLVIEDLISSGKSSLNAIKALEASGLKVEGLFAIFDYQLKASEQHILSKAFYYKSLSDYDALIQAAEQKKYINSSQREVLLKWKADPEHWADNI